MNKRISADKASIGYWACLSVVAVILPALAILMTEGRASFAMALAVCVTVYSGYRLSYLAFFSPRSMLQLTFWMFVYCWLGLAASVQLKADLYPWPRATDSDGFLWTEALIIVGIAAYEMGVRFKGRPNGARPTILTIAPPSVQRFVILTLGCLAISSWAIYQQGGPSEVLRTRYEIGRTAKTSGRALSQRQTDISLQRVPPVVALLVAIYMFSDKLSSRRKRRFLAVSITALVLFNLVANYPPSLPRTFLGFILVSIAALVLRNRARFVPLFFLTMIFGLTVLFPYADYFRSQTGYTTADIASPTQKLIEKSDYDAFEMVANTVQAVKVRGVAYGYNFLGAALFFVPRSIWPEKPHGTGWTVGEIVGYSSLSLILSSPLWAEFYYGGGFPLLIVGFWFYGYLTRRAERQEFRPPIAAVFVAYAAGLQTYLLRGDLLNAVSIIAPGAILLFMFVCKPVRSRSAMRGPKRLMYSELGIWRPKGLLSETNSPVTIRRDGSPVL